jgi:hypothetical protein
MLQQLHRDLWIRAVPYRIKGLEIGRQLVVVRLPEGGLWIHSPIPVIPELRETLARLGPVRHVIGPNCYHDECLKEFQAEYPEAEYHAAPGLAAARPDIRFAHTLSDTPHPDWSGVMDQHLVQGMPKINEIAFFHRPSRSLIVADIVFYLGPPRPLFTRLFLRLFGVWNRFVGAKSFVDDRPATRASIDHLLAWDIDRILVGHGKNIETGGKAALREAFAFLYV